MELVNNEKIADSNKIIEVERLYIKEINFKIPYAPALFVTEDYKLDMVPTIEVSTKVQPVAKDKYEVALHAIVSAKSKNLSLFVLEVQQAGIFNINNISDAEIKPIVESYCASLLHPYLAQTIGNSIMQAGFPPLLLQPLQPKINIPQNELSN